MRLFKRANINSAGFSALELIVAVVVVGTIAFVGAKALNVSHADSGPNISVAGSCTITNVPTKVVPRVFITPTVHVKNTGSSTFTTTVNIVMAELGEGGGDQLTFTVKPGQTVTKTSDSSLVASPAGEKIKVTAASKTPPFSCTAQSIIT